MQESQVQPLGQEDSPGGGHGNPLQDSRLETPMDRGAWRATVRGDGSMPGFLVHHQLLESGQTHVHWVGDAI